MKILVCGGRKYADKTKLWVTLYAIAYERDDIIIHGDAPGADSLAGAWAQDSGIQEVKCPANWKLHGRSAGIRRNHSMLLLQPDLVLAFPGGPGTANMIKLAKAANIEVREIE